MYSIISLLSSWTKSKPCVLHVCCSVVTSPVYILWVTKYGSTIKYDHSGSVIAYYTIWFADSSVSFLSPYIVTSRDIKLCTTFCLLFNYVLYMICPQISQTEYNHENVANSYGISDYLYYMGYWELMSAHMLLNALLPPQHSIHMNSSKYEGSWCL